MEAGFVSMGTVLNQFFQIERQMISLKALRGKGVSIQNRKSRIGINRQWSEFCQ
jgi:hypothetical protein